MWAISSRTLSASDVHQGTSARQSGACEALLACVVVFLVFRIFLVAREARPPCATRVADGEGDPDHSRATQGSALGSPLGVGASPRCIRSGARRSFRALEKARHPGNQTRVPLVRSKHVSVQFHSVKRHCAALQRNRSRHAITRRTNRDESVAWADTLHVQKPTGRVPIAACVCHGVPWNPRGSPDRAMLVMPCRRLARHNATCAHSACAY